MTDTKNEEFDKWCLTAKDPKYEHQLTPVPYVTTMIYKVCGGDNNKFDEAIRILKAAFEAGQEHPKP